jgi:hypothetical protein
MNWVINSCRLRNDHQKKTARSGGNTSSQQQNFGMGEGHEVGTERGCVADQPQRVGKSVLRADYSIPLRLVCDTAALR